MAGIAAAALDGPLAVPRGETVIVASSFAQATIAFDHVVAFMGAKLRDRKRYRFWQTGQLSRIEDREIRGERAGARERPQAGARAGPGSDLVR